MDNTIRSGQRRWKHLRRQGFTLIELLLVLVILAVLAGIVVPRFAKRGEQARITAAQTQIDSFKTALNSFEVDCGRYPTQSESLRALVEQPGNLPGWKKYMDSLPNDPWGNPYVYRCPGGQNRDFDIISYGPDGQEGGGDDIESWTTTK